MVFPLDDECWFEDASLVYVKDRCGVLCSPPGYEKSTAIPTLRECDTVYGASCMVRHGTSQQSPRRLYNMCKNYVAKNLHLLESLQDFPEIVGHELFVEALQVESFRENPQGLIIFCEEYKHLVLNHLCLRQATVLLNEYLKHFQCFNSLTKLDLSHCRLGPDHEYLKFIGKMRSLECLFLKDNCLTDAGLLRWSLPHRLFNCGPEFLKTLDLSCNPSLTDASFKSLLKFSHLNSLDLSGTGVTFTSSYFNLKKIMNFEMVSYAKEFSELNTTSGWAAPLISELFSKVNEKRSNENKWMTSGEFYQKLGRTAANASPTICTNVYPVIVLKSVDDVLPDTRRTLSRPVEDFGEKRLASSENILSLKRRKMNENEKNDLNINDTMLLDSYLKYV